MSNSFLDWNRARLDPNNPWVEAISVVLRLPFVPPGGPVDHHVAVAVVVGTVVEGPW
jgi:hypothetical protein